MQFIQIPNLPVESLNPRTTSLFLSPYTPSTERRKMTQARRTRVKQGRNDRRKYAWN